MTEQEDVAAATASARWGGLAMCLCLALGVLSPAARGADGAPARGPLTAAEHKQCQAQLTGLNDGVRTHNNKVKDIEALEAEIDALRAELDAEQPGLDRQNSAVMQAFNAKVRKNNELVARHKDFGAELTASLGEIKKRKQEFHEACENRPAALLPAQPQQPPPFDPSCNPAAGAGEVQRKLASVLADMRSDEKVRQAEVERVTQSRAAAQSWSQEQQARLTMQILVSPRFLAFEQEKQPLVQELMRMVESKPTSGKAPCPLVQRMAAILPAAKAINKRQYAFVADEIRAAK